MDEGLGDQVRVSNRRRQPYDEKVTSFPKGVLPLNSSGFQ